MKFLEVELKLKFCSETSIHIGVLTLPYTVCVLNGSSQMLNVLKGQVCQKGALWSSFGILLPAVDQCDSVNYLQVCLLCQLCRHMCRCTVMSVSTLCFRN